MNSSTHSLIAETFTKWPVWALLKDTDVRDMDLIWYQWKSSTNEQPPHQPTITNLGCFTLCNYDFKKLLIKLWSLGQQDQNHPWASQNCWISGPIQSHPRDWKSRLVACSSGDSRCAESALLTSAQSSVHHTVYHGLFLTAEPLTFGNCRTQLEWHGHQRKLQSSQTSPSASYWMWIYVHLHTCLSTALKITMSYFYT